MKDPTVLLYFFTLFSIYTVNNSFAKPSPVPDSSFVFPDSSVSDDYNPSSRSFGDYYNPSGGSYEENLERRHLYGYKRRYPRPYLSTGHGCRGHRCDYEGYGSQPDYRGYYPQSQSPDGSFATASAGTRDPSNHLGSIGGNGPIISQANAQSATFNFGPFSASFSNAQATSGPNESYGYNRPTNFNY